MAAPRIGITVNVEVARWGVWEEPTFLLPRSYSRAVARAGGLPVLIGPELPAGVPAPDLLDGLDGLVLSGGCDVDPGFYGAERHPETLGTVPVRDEFEIALVGAALDRGMPFLGICRGMQVLNVALGGTLIQHLPDHVGHGDHRINPGSFDGSEHGVELVAGSRAAQAAGETRHTIKSHHHQGVDCLGAGLVVTGHSLLDGFPEAIELDGGGFVLGVQWHPEADETSQVVGALVRAAASA